MPQHKSAEKRVRQTERRNKRNRARKADLKKLVKAVKAATDKDGAEKALKAVVQKLDRLSVKGIVHKNTAANRKSKLAKMVNKIGKPTEAKAAEPKAAK